MPEAPIFHITTRAAWTEAKAVGLYAADSMDDEGFIHASTRKQVVTVANTIFRGRNDLVLLRIDPSLVQAEIRWEPQSPGLPTVEAGVSHFPHIYGPLNLDAVKVVANFPANPDGTFSWPDI